MFCGLQIEIGDLKIAEQWLNGSDWCEGLVNSGITTTGMSDSYLHASHIKCTRYAHRAFVAALYSLQKQSYSEFVLACSIDSSESFNTGD